MRNACQQRRGPTGPQLQRCSSATCIKIRKCWGMSHKAMLMLVNLVTEKPHLPSQKLVYPQQEPRQGRVLAACLPPALQGEAAGSWEQLLFDQDHKGTAQHLSFA